MQKFCKGEANLGYFKKREGVGGSCKKRQEDNVKKISFW